MGRGQGPDPARIGTAGTGCQALWSLPRTLCWRRRPLFFELLRQKHLPRRRSYLSDNNDRLLEAYRGVQQDVDAVIALLLGHKERHCKEYYYEVRSNVPEDPIGTRAARIIYLNRTCFNGLFRENSKGLFNVPFGRYKNPMICDEENLREVAKALKWTRLRTQCFQAVLDDAEPGDLVYFDPPYHPLSDTANFTAYHRGGFG